MTIVITNAPTSNDSLPTVLFQSVFDSGILSASTEATGYPKENILDESTAKSWKPTARPATISVDCGSTTTVDAFAVIAHNLWTCGCSVVFQTSTDGITYTNAAPSVTPTDNTTILQLFTPITFRYFRVRITGGTANPNIGRILLGSRLTFPAGVKAPYTPIWASQQYELLTSTTLGGQFLGNRVLRQGGRTVINLVSFERTFAESNLTSFREHYNSGKAFVWAAGPSIFDKDVGYVWRTEGSTMSPTFDENGSWMSVAMEVNAYGE